MQCALLDFLKCYLTITLLSQQFLKVAIERRYTRKTRAIHKKSESVHLMKDDYSMKSYSKARMGLTLHQFHCDHNIITIRFNSYRQLSVDSCSRKSTFRLYPATTEIGCHHRHAWRPRKSAHLQHLQLVPKGSDVPVSIESETNRRSPENNLLANNFVENAVDILPSSIPMDNRHHRSSQFEYKPSSPKTCQMHCKTIILFSHLYLPIQQNVVSKSWQIHRPECAINTLTLHSTHKQKETICFQTFVVWASSLLHPLKTSNLLQNASVTFITDIIQDPFH